MRYQAKKEIPICGDSKLGMGFCFQSVFNNFYGGTTFVEEQLSATENGKPNRSVAMAGQKRNLMGT